MSAITRQTVKNGTRDVQPEALVAEAPVEEPLAAAAVDEAPVEAEALRQAVLDDVWMVNWPERPVEPVLSTITRANSWPAGSLTVHWKGELWTLELSSSTRLLEASLRRRSNGAILILIRIITFWV